MADNRWIKLRTEMFDDDKIKIVQAMPEGDSLIVIWIRMLILAEASNAEGCLMISDSLPYSEEMLATVFNKSLSVIRLAVKTFEAFGMVKVENGGIRIQSFAEDQNEKSQDIREYNRLKKAESRKRAKQKCLGMSNPEEIDRENCVEDKSITSQDYVIDQSRTSQEKCQGQVNDRSRTSQEKCQGQVNDQEKEKAKEKEREEKERTKEREEKEKEREKEKEDDVSSDEDTLSVSLREPDFELSKKIAYQRIMEDYNRTCTALPSIRAITEERKTQIRALMNGMDRDRILPDKSVYERLHSIFQNAQDSDFLSGRDGCWAGCAFDWLIKKKNALKVLEGTYANKSGRAHLAEKKSANRFTDFSQRNYSEQDYRKMEEALLGKDCHKSLNGEEAR